MYYGLMIVIAIAIYAIAEGITEALMWETMCEISENERVSTSKGKLFEGDYHFFRIIETIGIIGLCGSLFFSSPSLITGFFYGIGGIFFGFLIYRSSFVITRKKQTLKEHLSPTWFFIIRNPFYWLTKKTELFYILYPSRNFIIIAGFLGMLLILIAEPLSVEILSVFQ